MGFLWVAFLGFSRIFHFRSKSMPLLPAAIAHHRRGAGQGVTHYPANETENDIHTHYIVKFGTHHVFLYRWRLSP